MMISSSRAERGEAMTSQQWGAALSRLAAAFVQTPVFLKHHSLTMTPARARLLITQKAINIRNRRDCWAALFSRCPELPVRQKILEHEYEELIEDEHSKYGHLDLTVRQAAAVGLSAEQVLNAEPLPITRAICYAYLWYIQSHTWQESLAGMIANEMKNASSPELAKHGGGAEREARRWMEDLHLSKADVPDAVAHSKADQKHGQMFLSTLERYVAPEDEARVVAAAQESLDLRALWYAGLTAVAEELKD
jgi:pyrroloquinoline quinone (PQQ) biosynthesis protein C